MSPSGKSNLEPLLANPATRTLWTYFLGLSRIPRESQHEQAAAAWAAEQGRILGCEVAQDAAGNVRIRKTASPGREHSPGLAVQAHIDMVCEKVEGSSHDFRKDPLELELEGDLLRARGTSLGADNGIGVAAALALLADPGPAHGPLEALITVDEEKGLTGARSLAPGWLRSDYLINLDGDGQGILTIGGAGRVDTIATRTCDLRRPGDGKRSFRLEVTGLSGGHSGLEIHRGLGNALRLLAQILCTTETRYGLELADLTCANPRNAIPREACAVFFMYPAMETVLREELTRQESHWRSVFGALEPGLSFRLLPSEASLVLASDDARRLVRLLLALPHGVEAMSPDQPSLVQTSTNLAAAHVREGLAEVILMTRSSLAGSKLALRDRIESACGLADFRCRHENDYPGWQPDARSPLVKLVSEAHAALFGTDITISALHADLECGMIGAKHPGLRMVSISPDMWGTHTPTERLSISSSVAFQQLLLEIVARNH